MAMAYPEAVCLRRQMADALVGKRIEAVGVEDIASSAGDWRLGSITQPPDVFRQRLEGGEITGAESVANTVFLNASTGHALALGYISGKVLHCEPGAKVPARSCLTVRYSDQSHLAVVVSLWGLIRVLGDEERLAYVARWYGGAVEPNSGSFTLEGLQGAVAEVGDEKLSVKKFLHAFGPCYYVSGIDSGYAMEILHRAKVHPKRKVTSLTADEQEALYRSVNEVMSEATDQGGRHSEVDLHGRPGGFVPRVCKETLGRPCAQCGATIEKISFEGGACYVCPGCQVL